MSTTDPNQIRAEIEVTREELGETVEALAAKTDVAGQAKRKIEETKAQVSEKAEDVIGKVREAAPESAAAAAAQATHAARQNPVPLGLLGAFAAGFALGRLTSR
jgi:ElaB/YqjD/DUF883 family membrane-anchored ribosome-binding protein